MNEMVYYDEITQSLSKAVYHANQNLRNTIGLLRMTLCDHMWRKRLVTVTGKIVEFEDFEDYVKALPPEGLGTDLDTLRLICASDPALLKLIDDALKTNSTKKNAQVKHSKPSKPIPSSYPRFSKEWTLDRLKTVNRPDLVKLLKSGKTTPYRVQIEMGWRKKSAKNSP